MDDDIGGILMITVIFNDSNEKCNVCGITYEKNIITLIGISPLPLNSTGGFKIYKGDQLLNDYSEYKYKFNVLTEFDDVVILSKDEKIVESEDNPASNYYTKPTQFTDEQIQEMLFQDKKEKISQSKVALSIFLEKNPLISFAHNETEGVYSVTPEKQSLMSNQYMTYQIEKQINPDAKLTWNESGKECEVWTEQEFLQLIAEVKAYVYPLVSYQQSLETQIMNCTTQEELDNITIDYSSVVSKVRKE